MARRYRYEYLMRKRAKERARKEREERIQNLSSSERKVRELIGWGLYIAVLVCAIHLVTTYVGQRTVVAGDSMLNTIHDKDNLIIDKVSYRFSDTIQIILNKDGSATVIDNGRGIPVGINQKAGLPAVEVVFTVLHAGGKFGGGGYKVSGGLHGVGASVVNALSEWLEVEICKDGKIHKQRYERGKVMYPLKVVGECDIEKTGTKVTFLPDKEIFEENKRFLKKITITLFLFSNFIK